MSKFILAKDIIPKLKQGDKVKYRMAGHDYESVGRIEIHPKSESVFFVHEFNYDGDILTRESMRYYNPVSGCYWYFEII